MIEKGTGNFRWAMLIIILVYIGIQSWCSQKITMNIDEPLLRQIAAETGGLYFRARDNTSLQNIYTEIDKLEKTKKRLCGRFFDTYLSGLKRLSRSSS